MPGFSPRCRSSRRPSWWPHFPAALPVVLQTRTEPCAQGTGLDEREQLARKHHRLRCVHHPDPLTLRHLATGVGIRSSLPRGTTSLVSAILPACEGHPRFYSGHRRFRCRHSRLLRRHSRESGNPLLQAPRTPNRKRSTEVRVKILVRNAYRNGWETLARYSKEVKSRCGRLRRGER